MIRGVPDPVLHEKCRPVESEEVRDIVRALWAALEWSAAHGRPGIGLAAPQIGQAVRIFVLGGYPAFVNPRILKLSTERSVELEACLSLSATEKVRVSRPKWVKLVAQDETGAARTMKLHGWNARAALHELDHLEGILITDRGDIVPNTHAEMQRPRGAAA